MFNIIPLRKVWNERRVTKIIGSKKDIFKTKRNIDRNRYSFRSSEGNRTPI